MCWKKFRERIWMPEKVKKRLPEKLFGMIQREYLWLFLALFVPLLIVFLFLAALATVVTDPDQLEAKTKVLGFLLPIYYGVILSKLVAEYIQSRP